MDEEQKNLPTLVLAMEIEMREIIKYRAQLDASIDSITTKLAKVKQEFGIPTSDPSAPIQVTQREFCDLLCNNTKGKVLIKSAANDPLKLIKVKHKGRINIKISGKTFYLKEVSRLEDDIMGVPLFEVSLEANQEIGSHLKNYNINWSDKLLKEEEILRILKGPPTREDNGKSRREYVSVIPPTVNSSLALLSHPKPFQQSNGYFNSQKCAKLNEEQASPCSNLIPNFFSESILDFLLTEELEEVQEKNAEKTASDGSTISLPPKFNSDFFHTLSSKNQESFDWILGIDAKGEEAIVSVEWDKEYGFLYSNEPFNPLIHQRVSATSFNYAGAGVRGPEDKLKQAKEPWRYLSRIPVVTIGITKVKCLLNEEVERMKNEYPASLLPRLAENEIKKDGSMALTCSPESGVALCLSWTSIKLNNLLNYVVGVPFECYSGTQASFVHVACWIAPVVGSSFEQNLSHACLVERGLSLESKEILLNDCLPFDSQAMDDKVASYHNLVQLHHANTAPDQSADSLSPSLTQRNPIASAVQDSGVVPAVGEGGRDSGSSESNEYPDLSDLHITEIDEEYSLEEACVCGAQLIQKSASSTKSPTPTLTCSICQRPMDSMVDYYSCPRINAKHPDHWPSFHLCVSCLDAGKHCSKTSLLPSPATRKSHSKTILWRNTTFDTYGNESLLDSLLNVTCAYLAKRNLSALQIISSIDPALRKNILVICNSRDVAFFIDILLKEFFIPKRNIIIFTGDENFSFPDPSIRVFYKDFNYVLPAVIQFINSL